MHIIKARQLHVVLHPEQLVAKTELPRVQLEPTTCCVLDVQVLYQLSCLRWVSPNPTILGKATNLISRQNVIRISCSVESVFLCSMTLFRYMYINKSAHVVKFCGSCGSGGEWGKGGGGGSGGGWRVRIPPEAADFSLKDDNLG